jgi:hypothetical protein
VKRSQFRRTWKPGTIVALAAVVGLASPAAAATSTTTVTASPSAAYVGAPVTLTATVTCDVDPSGNDLGVTFWDGGTPIDSRTVGANGQAVLSTSFTTAGSHKITAAYNGNGTCDASNGETTVEVSALPVPPTPPANGLCLLTCSSLFGFSVGDINQHVEVH